MPKILVVDDEPVLLNTLRPIIERAGFEVLAATDGDAALKMARQEMPDLIILDVMLPRITGFEVCRILRQESTIPIIMLTAMGDELDKVVGLEAGADDYLTKPFGAWELLARMKAVLRRSGMAQHGDKEAQAPDKASQTNILKEGDLQIDLISRRALLAGKHLDLKPRVFDLLAFLVHNRGRVCSQQELLNRVWGYEDDSDTRTVAVHIRHLRRKLEADPSKPRLIKTVRGVGYCYSPHDPESIAIGAATVPEN
ncbi:MAG TPA: response regulator transcription factor [Chloroflexota bacterium]|nr:response regulator transcription factor [Chloroflexota bacterium]